jgi:hypothetical protein
VHGAGGPLAGRADPGVRDGVAGLEPGQAAGADRGDRAGHGQVGIAGVAGRTAAGPAVAVVTAQPRASACRRCTRRTISAGPGGGTCWIGWVTGCAANRARFSCCGLTRWSARWASAASITWARGPSGWTPRVATGKRAARRRTQVAADADLVARRRLPVALLAGHWLTGLPDARAAAILAIDRCRPASVMVRFMGDSSSSWPLSDGNQSRARRGEEASPGRVTLRPEDRTSR